MTVVHDVWADRFSGCEAALPGGASRFWPDACVAVDVGQSGAGFVASTPWTAPDSTRIWKLARSIAWYGLRAVRAVVERRIWVLLVIASG